MLVEKVKTYSIKIDEDEPRTVTARFATLGVVDLDGDVIEAGAIGDQSALLGAYNHDFQSLPPGYGVTYETKTEAMFRAKFFETPAGEAHYQTLKAADEAGYNMEWSFRFFVEEGGFETRDGEDYYIIRKARVSHVAPVEKGAGINTGTVSIKSCGPECQAGLDGGGAGKVQDLPGFSKQLQNAAMQKDSMLIDYSKLAEALGPILQSAVDGAVSRIMDEKGTGECGCGDAAKAQAEVDSAVAAQALEEAKADSQTNSVEKEAVSADQAGDGTRHKGQGLGDLLRELRDEKELSNDDLADAAGLSVASIGGILAGTTDCPKVGQLQGMARKLGINLSRLVQAAEEDGCGQYEDSSEQASADDTGLFPDTGIFRGGSPPKTKTVV